MNKNNVQIFTNTFQESESGKPAELPYDVDSDFAMKQPEVAKRVAASIASLSAASDKFLNSFIRSKDKIP